MTIAEEVSSYWAGVQQKPAKGAEAAYYADLLRKVMVSKKHLEETGRKYSILPDLRELTRRTLVRIPAQHVAYLEVSVFDLISNPLKTNLQPFVSEFSATGADVELVSWFVRHARNEPSLALDFKALQAWLEKVQPASVSSPSSASEGPESMTRGHSSSRSSAAPASPDASPSSDSSSSPSGSSSSLSSSSDPTQPQSCPSSDSSSPVSGSSSSDTTVATPPVPDNDGTPADRIFEHD